MQIEYLTGNIIAYCEKNLKTITEPTFNLLNPNLPTNRYVWILTAYTDYNDFFVKSPRFFTIAKLLILKLGSSSVLRIISILITIDDDLAKRFAVLDIHDVFTESVILLFTLQTFKQLFRITLAGIKVYFAV